MELCYYYNIMEHKEQASHIAPVWEENQTFSILQLLGHPTPELQLDVNCIII